MTTRQLCHWHTFATAAALEQAAAQHILAAAERAIRQRGAFHLVLAGGTTPRRVYQSLRQARADWAGWHIYLGDERCLPVDHVERNRRMAGEAWLDHVGIPAAQIHDIPAELGADAAAQGYARRLVGVGEFDLVLLGLGEDGHTASLFPGHDWGVEAFAPDALAVFEAPKPPPERVSLSARRLSAAREVIFLVTGQGKRDAVQAWRQGQSIPAASIAPLHGVEVWLEQALLTRE
jgi:6-phosphogluconolactonase